MMEYLILNERMTTGGTINVSELRNTIKLYIKEGWKPNGSPVVIGDFICQPMIRETFDKPERKKKKYKALSCFGLSSLINDLNNAINEGWSKDSEIFSESISDKTLYEVVVSIEE